MKLSREELEKDPKWTKIEKTFEINLDKSKNEQTVMIAYLISMLKSSGHEIGFYVESKPPKPGYNRVAVDFDLKSQWYYHENKDGTT